MTALIEAWSVTLVLASAPPMSERTVTVSVTSAMASAESVEVMVMALRAVAIQNLAAHFALGDGGVHLAVDDDVGADEVGDLVGLLRVGDALQTGLLLELPLGDVGVDGGEAVLAQLLAQPGVEDAVADDGDGLGAALGADRLGAVVGDHHEDALLLLDVEQGLDGHHILVHLGLRHLGADLDLHHLVGLGRVDDLELAHVPDGVGGDEVLDQRVVLDLAVARHVRAHGLLHRFAQCGVAGLLFCGGLVVVDDGRLTRRLDHLHRRPRLGRLGGLRRHRSARHQAQRGHDCNQEILHDAPAPSGRGHARRAASVEFVRALTR
ncbi:MAG: hypothetical protein QM765_01630 [Myxococcales bacterium]